MNNMIKNIFVASAIAITFAPALHCTNKEVQAPANKGRLQSAIDYVKNIRTPLTAQEKLAQHIAQADLSGFKTAYDAFMQSDVTPAKRTAITQELTANAQAVKQQLQTALDTMGDAQTNKTMLAKGVAQGIGSTALFISATCLAIANYKAVVILSDKDWNDWLKTSLINKTLMTPPIVWIAESLMLVNSLIKKSSPKSELGKTVRKLAFYTSFFTPLLGGTTLGAYGLKSGIQNCKKGWNYKAYLQQQIKNIDEIIEHITAKQQ